jgi:hypothetical protein
MNQEAIRQALDEIIARCEDVYARYAWARHEATQADLTVLFATYAEQYALAITTFQQWGSVHLGNGVHENEPGQTTRSTQPWLEYLDKLDRTTSIRREQLLAACIHGEELIRERCVVLATQELPTQLAAHIRQQEQRASAALAVLRAQLSLTPSGTAEELPIVAGRTAI